MGFVVGRFFVSRNITRHDFDDFCFRFHSARAPVHGRASMSLVLRAGARYSLDDKHRSDSYLSLIYTDGGRLGMKGDGGQGPARRPKLISDSWIDTISHMRAT